MKIAIFGFYGTNNFGDDLILFNIINNLNKLYQIEKIDIFVSGNNLPVNIFENINIKINTYTYERFQYYNVVKNYNVLKKIKTSNIILIGGGGIIQDAHGWKTIPKYLVVSLLANYYEKKVIWFSVGIGPIISYPNRILLKRVLKLINNDIYTRDVYSKNILENIGVRNNIIVSSDPSFLLDNTSYSLIKNTNSFNIGISIRSFHLTEKSKEEIIKLINHLNTIDNCEIYFFNTENDNDIIKKLIEKLSLNNYHFCNYTDLYKMISDITKMDLMIGMRFHMLLVSILFEIPIIGFSYLPKVSSLCDMFNQKCYNMNEISCKNIIEDINNIIEINPVIDNNVYKEMRERAILPFRELESNNIKISYGKRIKMYCIYNLIFLYIYTRIFYDIMGTKVKSLKNK